MAKGKLTMPEITVKEAAVKGLEYALAQSIAQFELRFNIKVDCIKLGNGDQRTGMLHGSSGIKLQWHETAEGILTPEEMQERLAQAISQARITITDKLAGNG